MVGYISSFTVTVVCVILLSFILRAMMPRSSLEKYVNFIIGIIVVITIAGSFAGAAEFDFDDVIEADTSEALTRENASVMYNMKIADSFRTRLEESVSEYVLSICAAECETDIMISTDEEGAVTGVDGVYVRLYGAAGIDELRRALSKQFGFSGDIIHIE